jgi:hypothetical protein
MESGGLNEEAARYYAKMEVWKKNPVFPFSLEEMQDPFLNPIDRRHKYHEKLAKWRIGLLEKKPKSPNDIERGLNFQMRER